MTTATEIQEFIKVNNTMSNSDIAKKLKVKEQRVIANKAVVSRMLNKETTVKDSKSLKALTSMYEQLKKEGNTYTNAKGSNKAIARVKMKNEIVASGITGTVLTLPHMACEIEKSILAETSLMNFVGCEIDKPTYNGMRKTVRNENLPIQTHFGAIADKIYGFDANSYAHMILDYCGNIVTFDKELRYTFDNDLVKVGGTVSVTFSKRGYSNPNNVVKNLTKFTTNSNDSRSEMEVGVEAYFNKLIGWGYEITEIFNYCDTSPMMLVQIKRVK